MHKLNRDRTPWALGLQRDVRTVPANASDCMDAGVLSRFSRESATTWPTEFWLLLSCHSRGIAEGQLATFRRCGYSGASVDLPGKVDGR